MRAGKAMSSAYVRSSRVSSSTSLKPWRSRHGDVEALRAHAPASVLGREAAVSSTSLGRQMRGEDERTAILRLDGRATRPTCRAGRARARGPDLAATAGSRRSGRPHRAGARRRSSAGSGVAQRVAQRRRRTLALRRAAANDGLRWRSTSWPTAAARIAARRRRQARSSAAATSGPRSRPTIGGGPYPALQSGCVT